ncbi:MAG: primosomal protein N' [Planctomycetota bacterium]
MSRKHRSNPGQLKLFDDSAQPQPVPCKQQKAAPVVEASAEQTVSPVFAHLAEVAVVGPVQGTFTYSADAVWNDLKPGVRVLVPFGHRTATGFFIRERTEPITTGTRRLKPILRVLDEPDGETLITPTLLQLAHWIARHYVCPLGSTLAAMLPAGVKQGAVAACVRMVAPRVSADELLRQAESLTKTKPKQAAMLLALADNLRTKTGAAAEAQISAAALLHAVEAPNSALKALEKAGLLTISEQRFDTGQSFDHADTREVDDLVLNAEQQTALTKIEAALSLTPSSNPGPVCAGFLLQGVTGSGKTEVYLRALKTALAQGKQGLVLVPEIALTPQTAQRFEQRLGRERVAVLHSHMTDGERAEAWRAARSGKIGVVIGARSALFAPLPRVGLIVIDEEHENAFKQESTPRYHARDTAMELARLSNAVLVLGSATPSLEALRAAQTGQLTHLFLTRRVAGRPLPPVEIVDMTHENRETQRYSYLSRQLIRALDESLARREQVILFMNRRGFATVITCLRCGHTEKCPHCDVTLTSHRQIGLESKVPHSSGTDVRHPGLLTCHYCGASKPIPEFCGGCNAPGLKHWGLGTERVENEVRKTFPAARVVRMDSDTMTHRTKYLEALGNFRAGRTDILIGTQMIAKGLDFPNVTLVGVVLADTSLHLPDFRSRERTFQLLAQVAGRAGRSEKGGRVIVQTHLPKDPAIRAAAQHDYETFSLNELRERRAYSYPPFTRLARIVIRGKDQQQTKLAAETVAEALRTESRLKFAAESNQKTVPQASRLPSVAQPSDLITCSILGPAEAPLAKLEGYFRQHILLKAVSSEILSEILLGPVRETINKLKKVAVVVDVDALAML